LKPINFIIKWYLQQRMSRINFFIQNPVEAQEKVLNYLIESAANTSWGMQFQYNNIKNYNDFKNRFPIQDYETLKPFIERMMQGEQNVLWHSPINWFAKSSGTTADKSKFIPVSIESLDDCHFRGGLDVMSLYVEQFNDTKIFSGKALVMGGSHEINPFNEHVRFGDVSAVMMQNMPLLGQYLRTPSLDIALMSEWEAKLEKIAESVINEDVTHIVGVPTWTLIVLKEVLQRTGKKYLNEVWPDIQLYIHGGVSFTPYKEQFKALFKENTLHYMETYNASEGFLGAQNDITQNDMLLMLDYGIFYEFINADEANDSNPKVYSLDEIEIGKNYAVIISTNAGLWRYKIGDTIKFTSKYPFKFQITGRTKQFINAFGEEVMVDNTDKALALVCKQHHVTVKDYTVAPVYISEGKKGCHQWLIEFEVNPENIDLFAAELDIALQNINSDYEAKRYKDIALSCLQIVPLPENTFYNWLKAKGKLGGQNKVPRLSNDRKYVEQILELLKDN
jgi:hypothetical protein